MSLAAALVLALVALVLLFSLTWLVQLRSRNAGLVDSVWSWTLGLLAPWYAWCGTAPPQLRVLVGLLGAAWGLRLGTHLLLRNHGKPEDGRYARLRKQWAPAANRRMFWFFQLQVLFSLLLSISFAVVAWSPVEPGSLYTVAAVLLWLVSVAGEGLADWQLEQFKRDPASKGQVCRRGLWHYSRHPNYFFECLHWLAYPLLAAGSAWWWLGLGSPLVMAFLLLRLSGVPVTEAQTARSRPGYAEYIRTTSMLIPWPPKKR